jgi:hypothetical protein
MNKYYFQEVTGPAEFMRQAGRARSIFLEVMAGVVWAEMTVLYKAERRSRLATAGGPGDSDVDE